MKKSLLSLTVARTTAIAVVGLLVVACSSATDTDPATSDANVTNVQVGGTAGNQFSPAEVTVKVGGKVRWTFAGGAHNVVSGAACGAPDDKFAGSGKVPSTGTYEQLFATAGDYPYYCDAHCSMGMKGIVHVVP